MEAEYDEKLCDERHDKIRDEMADIWKHHNDLVSNLNSKFNKIMLAIVVTLLSVIGSLITLLLKYQE